MTPFLMPDDLRNPVQVPHQLSLFPSSRDEVLVKVKVSLDDMARWRERGWISYDVAALDTLEDHEIAEMMFVRDVARSGLSDAYVTALLSELAKPYAYPPFTTAYSFSYGWVQVSFPDMDEMMINYFDSWIEERSGRHELERLEDVQSRVMTAIGLLRADRKKQETG